MGDLDNSELFARGCDTSKTESSHLDMPHLHLDTSLEKARALHRVWRALNDGDCPKCHRHFQAARMYRPVDSHGNEGVMCPACKFHVTGKEIDKIEKLFAPAMDGCVAVFEKWREEESRQNEAKVKVNESRRNAQDERDTQDELETIPPPGWVTAPCASCGRPFTVQDRYAGTAKCNDCILALSRERETNRMKLNPQG